MWATEYSAVVNTGPDAVWAALRDLHSGVKLSERSDTFELGRHGRPVRLPGRQRVSTAGTRSGASAEASAA
jgi:hypothetical protein